ncbi:MAG: ATP-binding cassette domain-containing protein [Ruminococcaceae bacterium]|nr:ATP-binding cassette domain-containing protein [Oscillospiraceae bacterium]
MDNILSFDAVSLTLGETHIFHDFHLSLQPGQKKVIMGPSGCGKTSLFRLALGLIKPDSGRILCSAKRISAQFQEPRLLPWLTAAQNINLVLSDNKKTLPQALFYLSMVGLAQDAHKYPQELSGGMAQRVALARALAYEGDLLLLDEPFRGLDQALRDDMISLVKEQTKNSALLIITHDPEVAAQFGDVLTLS